MKQKAQLSLSRIWPRIEQKFADQVETEMWQIFKRRVDTHFEQLFTRLFSLYSHHYDFFYHLEQILILAAETWLVRSGELKELDLQRESNPHWFQSEQMVGGVCYVDLFAGDLAKLREKLPYFKELGLTYLHLMPLFKAPAGDSDGGYAVSDYRTVNPALGTMDELRLLASEFRREGISLVVDFVFNHTSDEHEWAKRALAGDPTYQEYYLIFPDRTMPDRYDRTLREIFPDSRPGCFTYRPEIKQWVWTTFNSFQWDLNYSNPMVFREMAAEMLYLANVGIEVLRFDALAFIWKEEGTDCENLPQAHTLIQAFNALVQIAAPTLLFKSEAIVHPDEVVKYIDAQECQLSYNPLLMALLWESLATRKTDLLRQSMSHRFAISPDCAWVNYVRCHDDIGWTFDDGDAYALGMNGFDHRRFLNAFYTGRFGGSFASGLPFQENPRTGDARISGSLASLAGLEQALNRQDEELVELAVRRILLLHAIILSIGGIPLIYLGDEVGYLNEYSYRSDPAKAGDSRWVHRPQIDWDKMASRTLSTAIEGRIYQQLQHLLKIRKAISALGGGQTAIIDVRNEHLFGYVRTATSGQEDERVVILANFSERRQSLQANELRLYGLCYSFVDLISEQPVQLESTLELAPYQVMWLAAKNKV